jgi:peptidyl-prolyl cis-trans isomerase B (cyclophilin B)
MAARQAAARRKRLLQARIGAGVAAVVVLGAVIWIVAAASGGGEEPVASASPTPTGCEWVNDFAVPSADPSDPAATPSPPVLPEGIQDVGTPPTDVPRSGYQVFTFETNLGVIKVESDLSKTPCTAASIAHLAGKGFYDNTSCHRLVPAIFALQCGDPAGTGSGGATYRFADENLPKDKLPAYTAGDVAMANQGQPATNGSQFFFLWDTTQLQGDYSLWGRVIEGLDIVKQVGAGGDDGAYEAQAGGGHPNVPITFTKVTAGPVTDTPAPVVTPSAAPTPEATPTPAATTTP